MTYKILELSLPLKGLSNIFSSSSIHALTILRGSAKLQSKFPTSGIHIQIYMLQNQIDELLKDYIYSQVYYSKI